MQAAHRPLLWLLFAAFSLHVIALGVPAVETQHLACDGCISVDHARPGSQGTELQPASATAAAARPRNQQRRLQEAPAAPDHKPLFPVNGLEVAVLVIAGVVLFIAAGAGMGGGPVLVPLYLVAGLNNTAAVALSNSTILAGSVGNTLVNIFKRHPYKNKPMIDWDLVLLMEPPTLIGAIAGSYINKLLPAWITSVLLLLLLALMTVRVAQRAARIYRRESAALRDEAAASAAAADAPAAAAAHPAKGPEPSTRAGPAQQHKPLSFTARSSATAEAVLDHGGQPQQAGALGSCAADEPAAAPGQGSHASSSSSTEEDLGVAGLLAHHAPAGAGPSDQHLHVLNNSSSSATTPAHHATDGFTPGEASGSVNVGSRTQQQQQQQEGHVHPHAQSVSPHSRQQQQVGAAGGVQVRQPNRSPLATPFDRPGSPMGRATSAPPPVTGGAVSAASSGYATPYRSTLSSVPSSVLLNLELEGNISEAALQRMATLELGSTAAAAAAGGVRAGHLLNDPVDASLASMDGVAGGQSGWWWWQRQAAAGAAVGPGSLRHRQQQGQGRGQQQQQQQQLEEGVEDAPSEAECRLLYAPPDHTRRDSWELAWDDEQEAAHSAGLGGCMVQHSPTPAATRQQPPSAAAAAAAAVAATANRGRPGRFGGMGRFWAPGQAATAGSSTRSQDAVGAGACGLAPAAPAQRSQGAGVPALSSTSGGNACDPAAQHGVAAEQQQQQQQQRKAPEVAAAATAGAVEAMLAAEAAQVPLLPALLLLMMFLAVLLTSLFSKMAPCGGAVYWVVQCAVVPVLGCVWWYSRQRVLAKVALKKAAQLDFHGEVRWTPRKTLVFPAICSIAGIIAGMFGLGGAVVKTPLMLELGVHPSVTAATTQTMLLLTSSASSIVYAQMGDTPWDWAAVMLPMAFAATLAGQAAIDWLVKKVGRSSMVVLVLAAFFIVATGLSAYTMAGAARAVAAHPELLGRLGKICRS